MLSSSDESTMPAGSRPVLIGYEGGPLCLTRSLPDIVYVAEFDNPEAIDVGEGGLRPRRVRLRLAPTLAVVSAVIVVWGIWAAVVGLQAFGAVRTAERDIRTLQRAVDLDRYLDGDLDQGVDQAIESLRRAEARLESIALKPIVVVPFFGRQLRSARSLVSSGLEVAQSAQESGLRLREILDDGTDLDLHDQLLMAASELESMAATLRGVDLGPDQGLVDRLRDGREEFDVQLSDLEGVLDEGARFLGAFGELLLGPEDHLLLIANNAEMRAGSGMILTTGVLRTSDGQIVLSDLGSSFFRNLNKGEVELTTTYEDHFKFLQPEAEWRNLAVTPRFPETAESALRMWEAATGEALDGALLVDPFFLKALLAGTGPLDVDGKIISENNVIEYLLHDQYLDFDVDFSNAERRAQERLVAAAALTQLHRGQLDVAKLVPALLSAAEGRHIMLWSPDDDRQRAWSEAGVDGGLTADSLAVSVSNRSPSKLDYFIELRAGIGSEAVGGVREIELMIVIDNTVDASSEPVYVVGPVAGSTAIPGEYVGLVTLNLPGAATGARFDGVEDLSVAGADGPTRIIATTVRVLAGERVTLTARFALPLSQETIEIEPSARPDPIGWVAGETRIRDGRRWTLDLDTLTELRVLR